MFSSLISQWKNKREYKRYKQNIEKFYSISQEQKDTLEPYNKHIDYKEQINWLNRKIYKYAKLIFHQCDISNVNYFDCIVWFDNAFSSVGPNNLHSLSVNGTLFENALTIHDVPPNWWRPVYNHLNPCCDSWQYVVSDLFMFEDQICKNMYCKRLNLDDGHTEFVVLGSKFMYLEFQYNVIMCSCIDDNVFENIWYDLLPIFTLNGLLDNEIVATMKNYFITQVKYAQFFATVTDNPEPFYTDHNDKLQYFTRFRSFREKLGNISFNDTIWIVPPIHNPSTITLRNFSVIIHYNPRLSNIFDVCKFLEYNNISYATNIVPNKRILFEKIDKCKVTNICEGTKLFTNITDMFK